MQPVITLTDVRLHRGETQILDGIDLAIRQGEHWALLGPNGAGKTTILSMCGARLYPSTGTVDILGHRLGRVAVQDLHARIGHVNPRHNLTMPLTVEQVVLTGFTGTLETPFRWSPTPAQRQRAAGLMAQMGLTSRAQAIWPTLSQGERGRSLIARALATNPELLLLDEPTTGLDVAAREQLLETLDDLADAHPDLTSILVTHHLEELPETTTHAALIAHGSLVASGPIDEALTTATVTEAFEHPIRVVKTGRRWGAHAQRTGSIH